MRICHTSSSIAPSVQTMAIGTLSVLVTFFLATDSLVDLFEVNPVVFRMRINVPDVDDPSLVVHAYHEAVLIVANIEDNKLLTDRISTSVRFSHIQWA